jgi:valyl-tRNA synthetase
VWYSNRAGEEGKYILPDISQLPVDPLMDLPKGYTREEVTGDKDVMDTWATSSLTPQISAGSIGPRHPGESRDPGRKEELDSGFRRNDERYKKLFPADLRPQAHEIIRTWAFYTIVKAHLHANTTPWKNLMISGWCLAADKTKMSKSKGNVVTPVALIEEKGTDAVRYWASTSRLGADTAFSEDLLKIGRKLVTKLWNASNFVSSVILSEAKDITPSQPKKILHCVQDDIITAPLDHWIITRLHRAVAKATEEFERFEYCDARLGVEDFFWNDFCDNYLELVKLRAYEKDASAQATLHYCLDAILRLFAPFVPHVTEEIYSHLFEGKGSIHARGQWPKAADYPVHEEAEKAGFAALQVLEAIRKAKSEAGVSIKMPVIAMQVPKETLAVVQPMLEDIKAAGSVTGEVTPGDFSITLGERQEKTA